MNRSIASVASYVAGGDAFGPSQAEPAPDVSPGPSISSPQGGGSGHGEFH